MGRAGKDRDRLIGKLYLKTLHLGHLAWRPMTMGVRGAAFDASGRVFLVRHTYISGWYLPGGGVSPGETAEAALLRELEEEGRLVSARRPVLVSAHFNRSASRRDHVLLYRLDEAAQKGERPPDREIAECGFFDPSALPDGTTPATRRRLAELIDGAEPDPHW